MAYRTGDNSSVARFSHDHGRYCQAYTALDDRTIDQLDVGTPAACDGAGGAPRWTCRREQATCGGTSGMLTRMRVSTAAVYAGCMRRDGARDAGGFRMARDPGIGRERWRKTVARYGMSLRFQPHATTGGADFVRAPSSTAASGVVALAASDVAELWHVAAEPSDDMGSTDGRWVFRADHTSLRR